MRSFNGLWRCFHKQADIGSRRGFQWNSDEQGQPKSWPRTDLSKCSTCGRKNHFRGPAKRAGRWIWRKHIAAKPLANGAGEHLAERLIPKLQNEIQLCFGNINLLFGCTATYHAHSCGIDGCCSVDDNSYRIVAAAATLRPSCNSMGVETNIEWWSRVQLERVRMNLSSLRLKIHPCVMGKVVKGGFGRSQVSFHCMGGSEIARTLVFLK